MKHLVQVTDETGQLYQSRDDGGAKVTTNVDPGPVGKGCWVTRPFSGDPLLKEYCLDTLDIFSTPDDLDSFT